MMVFMAWFVSGGLVTVFMWSWWTQIEGVVPRVLVFLLWGVLGPWFIASISYYWVAGAVWRWRFRRQVKRAVRDGGCAAGLEIVSREVRAIHRMRPGR